VRHELRQRRLEAGEAGWGKPVATPPQLAGRSRSKSFRVGVVGAGAQGIAQSQGLKALEIEIAGLAEIDSDRLKKAGDLLHLSQDQLFSSTEQMLARLGPLDLLCVATTAPSHVRLGRLGLKAGAKRVLLEKPVDISLTDARTFYQECLAAGVTLAVNYSRRWMLDYQAIERCIQGGFIGEARSISVMLGKGNLAMHASHYFDLCCFLFRSPPAGVVSRLEPIEEPNVRGAEFSDPSGHCLFSFQSGARAFLDFSSDLIAKDPFIVIKGTAGRITIDEPREFWTLQSQSNRTWTIPFVDSLKSSRLFSRVAAQILSRPEGEICDSDGLRALEMVLGAHLSQKRGNELVTFPLPDVEADLGVVFP